jgi:GNAT superfamily N-acetyltransferase
VIVRRGAADGAAGTVALELEDAGVIRARATLSVARDLVGAPGVSGLVGHWQAGDVSSGRHLLEAACRHFAEAGVARVLGPMNGDTWHAYRLVLPPGEQPEPPGGVVVPPFPGEPVNPPDAARAWRAAGFGIAARYESAIVLDLAAAGAAAARGDAPAGVTFRPLDPARFDEELALLHATSLRGFAANPYYAPIDRAEFVARNAPLRPRVDPRFVEFAVDEAGATLAFLFCFPLPAGQAGERPLLVAKTIAVVPEARGRRLGAHLFARAHSRAFELGFAGVIHALMHADNASTRMSAREHARTFRRYALFGRTP